MKLQILIVTFLLFTSNQLFSQRLNDILDTIQIKCKPNLDSKMKYCLSVEEKNGKIGWLNVLGEWIIPPIYSKRSGENMESNSSNSATESKWSEGIWVTNKNGLYGAINYKNEIVIPFIYKTEPTDCKDGIIIVKNNLGLYAYFNKYGKQLCKFQKKSLPEFRNGIATIVTYSADIRGAYIANISNQLIINNHLDTLLKLKNVKFNIKLEKKKHGIYALAIHPDFLIHADQGFGQGYYGFINRKGQFFTDINYKINQDFLGEHDIFAFDFHSNRLLIYEKNCYIDTTGKTITPYKPTNETVKLYNFNDFNVGSLQYANDKNYNYKQVLIDPDGNELFTTTNKNHIGIKGNEHSEASNDIIPIYDEMNHKQLFYTNDFKFLFGTPNYDDKYRYLPSICYPLELATDSLFLLVRRRNKQQEFYQGDQQIISLSGKPLSNWIPSKLRVSPLSGNLIYYGYNSIEKGQKLLNFSKEIMYECSNCNITPFENPKNNLQKFNEIGLFKVELTIDKKEKEKVNSEENIENEESFNGDFDFSEESENTSNKIIYINYKGINLSALCTKFEGDFKFINDQVDNFLPPPPVKFNFKESVLMNAFSKLYKY
jgi:hypothetical protein